jgi:hypothetical protein
MACAVKAVSNRAICFGLILHGTFTILHDFAGAPNDGGEPISIVISGSRLYGITPTGGKYSSQTNLYRGGTVFSYTP